MCHSSFGFTSDPDGEEKRLFGTKPSQLECSPALVGFETLLMSYLVEKIDKQDQTTRLMVGDRVIISYKFPTVTLSIYRPASSQYVKFLVRLEPWALTKDGLLGHQEQERLYFQSLQLDVSNVPGKHLKDKADFTDQAEWLLNFVFSKLVSNKVLAPLCQVSYKWRGGKPKNKDGRQIFTFRIADIDYVDQD